MATTIRLAGIVGVALVLVGGAGIVGGGYLQTTDECISGTQLEIDRLSENTTEFSQSERVRFDTLTAVEQRIFLEAYTGQHDLSRIYQNWSSSRFEGIRVVTYRGTQYEIGEVVVDCGISSYVIYLKFGGRGSFLLGIGVLALTGGWRVKQGINR